MNRSTPPLSTSLRGALACCALLVIGCDPAHLPNPGGDGGVIPGVCGDFFVSGTELCDDGNTDDGDGCDSSCQPEIPLGCGDGVREGTEECDDDNNDAGDGCGPGCWIERCGNSFLDPGEACEDNNTAAGDGCSADCKSDESCGNGIIDDVAGEVCDDGDGDNEDECPAATCEAARCGDGFKQRGIEGCDDGNEVANDGCTDCILDTCGNGSDDPGEECDLGGGNGVPGSTCFQNCLTTEVEVADPILFSINSFVSDGHIEVADLNSDGQLDVVTSTVDDGAVATAYGFGDGRFWPATRATGSGATTDLLLVDVDGDGDLDAIAPTSSSNTVLLYRSDGSQLVFETSFSTLIDIGGERPVAVTAAEVTGDGNIDLITANQTTADVTILDGDGAGGFTASARFPTGTAMTGLSPADIAVVDITDDGILDIVTANSGSDDVSVLPGLAGGGFGPPQITSTRIGAAGDTPRQLSVADVTNDGKPDVTTVNQTSSDITVLANQAGSLLPPLAFPTINGEGRGLSPAAMQVADVTQDGVVDVVVVGDNGATVLAGQGAGVAFAAPVFHPVEPLGQLPLAIAIGDLNADNIQDIVTANGSSDDLSVLLGMGEGAFAPPRRYSADRIDPRSISMADVNGDGNLDAVALNTGSALVTVAGLGNGTLSPSVSIASASTSQNGFGLADMNGDGLLDVSVSSSTSIRTLNFDDSGEATAAISASGSTITQTGVAVGEFNGSAGPDAISYSVSEVSPRTLINDGMGGLTTSSSITLGQEPHHILIVDVSGEGNNDAVMVTRDDSSVAIGLGDGQGGFAAASPISTQAASGGRNPVFLTVDDLDGDTNLDILTANQLTNDVSVLFGTGAGAFDAAVVVPAVFGGDAATVLVVRTGDFNGDGRRDIATANSARGTVSVILGFGNGSFAAPRSFSAGTQPLSIAVGDYNGDGRDDIVAADIDGTAIVLLSLGHP